MSPKIPKSDFYSRKPILWILPWSWWRIYNHNDWNCQLILDQFIGQSLVSDGQFWLGKVGWVGWLVGWLVFDHVRSVDLCVRMCLWKRCLKRTSRKIVVFLVHIWAQPCATPHKDTFQRTSVERDRDQDAMCVVICVAMLCGQMCWLIFRWRNEMIGSREFVQAKEEAEKQLSRVLAPCIACCKPFVSQFFFVKKIIFSPSSSSSSSSSMVSTCFHQEPSSWEVFPSTLWDGNMGYKTPAGWPCLSASRPSKWCLEWWKIWQKMLGSSMKFHGFSGLFGAFWDDGYAKKIIDLQCCQDLRLKFSARNCDFLFYFFLTWAVSRKQDNNWNSTHILPLLCGTFALNTRL